MNTLPKDPVMLLSFVNTQLRDHYPSLEEFAAIYQVDTADIISALKNIDSVSYTHLTLPTNSLV